MKKFVCQGRPGGAGQQRGPRRNAEHLQRDGVPSVQVQQDLIGEMAQGHHRGQRGGGVGRAVDEQPGAAGQSQGDVDVIGELIAPGGVHREHSVARVDGDVRGQQLAVGQGHQSAPQNDGDHRTAGVGGKGGGRKPACESVPGF